MLFQPFRNGSSRISLSHQYFAVSSWGADDDFVSPTILNCYLPPPPLCNKTFRSLTFLIAPPLTHHPPPRYYPNNKYRNIGLLFYLYQIEKIPAKLLFFSRVFGGVEDNLSVSPFMEERKTKT